MNDLQVIQDEFSDSSGVSFWICNCDNEFVTEKSLSTVFLGEDGKQIVDYVYTFVKNSGDENITTEISVNDVTIWVSKQIINVDNESIGYCVGIIDRENEQNIDEELFNEDVYLFNKIVTTIYSGLKENEKLRGELLKVKAAEKSVEEEKERLQHENDYDELTKVHSRSYFFKLLDSADKDESLLPISLVVGDVNNLKFTNDMFGHRHGDWLLCKIAQILMEEAMEEGYIVARCGGDEFFIFMPNTKRAGANYYCKRVTDRLAKENDTCLPPSISLGSAKKSEMSQSLHRLLEVADAKMYAVKSRFKQKLNQFDLMMEILYSRGFLTREGVERKVKLVSEFGNYIGWTSQKIQLCKYLVKYQDIGLSVVPERIYKKEGEYNDREWREIKKHPQLGMKIALIDSKIAPISEWMHSTHENYDGSGWPSALKGKAISQENTLVRLVTEFVEMEEKEGSDGAYKYIEEKTGIIFEPELAKKFIVFLQENVINKN